MTETTSGTINGNDCIELTLSQGTNATSSQLTLSNQLYRQAKIDEENRLIPDNDDDIYPTVKVTRDGELPENATESGNKEQLSTSKSKHKRERSDDKELLSPADEEENRPTSSTPSPPPPATAEKTKVKKSSSETTTIVYTNTSVPLLLDIMMDDIHPTNQSEQQYNEQDTYKLAAQSDNLTIVNSIIILV
ncbi:unnamed protein product [Rotaria sordida]|uniref:Uncharacterized protein n=1 Tax=Rotaria sordida TaxID=392033 RepID=A0A815GMA9_9BILA|nr:unnamed protein product [Rotaria sordida]CAF1597281.1 unnamed protein product [Rotaria sordida]